MGNWLSVPQFTLVYKVTSLPMRPYDINLLTAERAKLVTGPVVSSDLITSRKGPANIHKNNMNCMA